MIVRDNLIEDVGRDAAMLAPRAYSTGAINVFIHGDPKTELPIWPGNQHLVIENNTIRDCPGPGIGILGARDVKIQGNRLENVLYRPAQPTTGTPAAIAISGSENVQVGDNPLQHIGEEPAQH